MWCENNDFFKWTEPIKNSNNDRNCDTSSQTRNIRQLEAKDSKPLPTNDDFDKAFGFTPNVEPIWNFNPNAQNNVNFPKQQEYIQKWVNIWPNSSVQWNINWNNINIWVRK